MPSMHVSTGGTEHVTRDDTGKHSAIAIGQNTFVSKWKLHNPPPTWIKYCCMGHACDKVPIYS